MSPLVMLTLILFAGVVVVVLLLWTLLAPRQLLATPALQPRPRDLERERLYREAAVAMKAPSSASWEKSARAAERPQVSRAAPPIVPPVAPPATPPAIPRVAAPLPTKTLQPGAAPISNLNQFAAAKPQPPLRSAPPATPVAPKPAATRRRAEDDEDPFERFLRSSRE